MPAGEALANARGRRGAGRPTPGAPASPDGGTSPAGDSITGAPAGSVGSYLERLVETEGKMKAAPRTRLAAIVTAHRLAKHQDPTSRPLVKATLKRLAREYGKPRKQAK